MRVRTGGTGAAVGMVVGGALSVQFGAAFAALLFPLVGPLGAVTIRLVVAAVVLVAVVRPRLRGHRRGDYAVVVAFGLVLAAMNASIYEAIARLPLGVAVTLEFLGPLGLALATSRRWRDVVWVVSAGGGVVLLEGGAPSGLDWVGVVFALTAACCWVGYILLSGQTGRRFPRANGLALAMTVGAVAILPLGVLGAGTALVRPATLGLGALVALMSSVVPYTLELFALRRIGPGTFGILMSLDPALAAAAGVLVLGQHPGVWQLA
ncbi:MAG: EamA family transporter, partial [Acidothermales bacterium]|nr:EamA family transporter [Acidothermales bacterium]